MSQKNKELGASLNSLESENSKLQGEIAAMKGTDSATEQQKMEKQISSLEKKNAKLQRNVKKLKDEGVLYASDSRVANHVYSSALKASTSHVFK